MAGSNGRDPTIMGVVTLPGYRYSVTYYKAKGSPGLLVRYSVVKNDLRIRMTAAEFRVKAWKSGNPKGRKRKERSLVPELKQEFERVFSQKLKVTQERARRQRDDQTSDVALC
jgi:hypothetical protein